MTLAVHAKTQELIDHLATHLPQSLLLVGSKGVGLSTIARHIATLHSPHVHLIQPSRITKVPSISVEIIRDLYDIVRTKTNIKRIIIVDDADKMTVSAQNAFLKLLEEPSPDTYFILTTHQASSLLPTILSRLQRKEIHPITPNQTTAYIAQLGVSDERRQQQLHYIADGLPAELYRLVQDENYFMASAQQMKDARELLQGSTYEKLVLSHRYKEDREKAIALIEAATHITRRTLSDNAQPGLVRQLASLSITYDQLRSNQNIRLCLARLVI